MQLSDYYKIRTGVQRNAHRADATAVEHAARNLEETLRATGLFHTVEVDRTEDPDRLLIAMVGFAPGVDTHQVSATLERLWLDRVSFGFWAAHHTLIENGHVELQGSTRAGARGHYLTVHVLAQLAAVPAQRLQPVAAAPVLVAEPVAAAPSRTRSWGRLLGRPAPALAPA